MISNVCAPAGMERCCSSCRGVAASPPLFADMDDLLSSQAWLAGDKFSLADAAMAPYFQTLFQFGWNEWYADREHVADWYERCRARASYRDGVAADFSADKLKDLAVRGAPAWTKIQSILVGVKRHAA